MPLQIPHYKISHILIHMLGLQRVYDAVALRRIRHKLELFASLLQLKNELYRVLHMNVVVHCAVQD